MSGYYDGDDTRLCLDLLNEKKLALIWYRGRVLVHLERRGLAMPPVWRMEELEVAMHDKAQGVFGGLMMIFIEDDGGWYTTRNNAKLCTKFPFGCTKGSKINMVCRTIE